MGFRLPEHAVVALLRQCYTTPRCQALRCAGRSLPWSPAITNFTTFTYRHSLDKQPKLRKHVRSYQANNLYLENANNSTAHTNSSGSTAARLEGFRPSVNVIERHGDGRPQSKEGDRIAVLGGGITGLATAYYLARELPNAKITIYEASGRLGGWLQSQRVDVSDGSVLFESGPRTLRPNTPAALVTLEMVKDLGLEDQLLITSSTSAAARNRFVYYPDRLMRMPGPGQDFYSMAWSLLTEPIFSNLALGALMEFRKDPRPSDLDDESVGSFLSRRLGSSAPGDNIVSAVLHGVYAGDIYQLSIKSLAPKLWYYESSCNNISSALVQAMTQGTDWIPLADAKLQNDLLQSVDTSLLYRMSSASVYTFKEGIGALSQALEAKLRQNPNVKIFLNQSVAKVEYDGDKRDIHITAANGQPPVNYQKAISTISGKSLSTLSPGNIPSLAGMHAVTVMVVNLYYADPELLPERGFGYLIPRSIDFNQNPERALGVVFDSESSIGQDPIAGTKVTVMFGGHWWDGFDVYPDEEEGAAMAKAVLRRHLRIEAEPTAIKVGVQKECIPQYTVGHEARMKAAHNELFSEFNGKLSVAGNSFKGVGLNDCVRSARDVVMSIKDGGAATGLEEFVRPKAWAQTKSAKTA